jgi:NAD(P)-dependent dehydrogenase (short-subunit alcohol dehydrogenase family)
MSDSGRELLAGRTALVTGATRGVGRATAFALAAAGADIVVVSRRAEACEETAEALIRETGCTALSLPANVSRWGDCDELVDSLRRSARRVDILVNNAGSSPPYPDVTSISEAMFDKVVGLNLRGPFRLSALIGEDMARGDAGAIINVSSISATLGSPRAVVYAAAKAGLNNITQSFAELLAPRVRVNAVMPGTIDTDVTLGWSAERVEHARSAALLGRMGEPSDVAGLIVFLASPAAAFITGQVLTIDGGRRAWSVEAP